MLRADKLQNQKDFLAYHAKSHPRRDVLARYFELWLQRLGVTPALAQQCNQAMRTGP